MTVKLFENFFVGPLNQSQLTLEKEERKRMTCCSIKVLASPSYQHNFKNVNTMDSESNMSNKANATSIVDYPQCENFFHFPPLVNFTV